MSKPDVPFDTSIDAPEARRRPTRLVAHGEIRSDDFYWLREVENPEVLEYLRSENDYAEFVLGSSAKLRDTLLEEIRSRIPPAEQSVPYRDGQYYYYHRYREGQEYPVYCRKRERLDDDEEVLLDVSALAAKHDYFALDTFVISPDHSRAAFAVDTEGRRRFSIQFLDLRTKSLLNDRIADVTSYCEWANDNETLFYVRQDPDTLRDHQVWRHTLGDDSAVLVYQENNDANWVSIERSLSGRCLCIESGATIDTEVRVLSTEEPFGEARIFQLRERGHEYTVIDGVDRYYVLSNLGAQNFQLFETDLDCTVRSAWRTVVAHREGVLIEDVEVFESFIVLSTVVDGLDRIEIYRRGDPPDGRNCTVIEFEEPVHVVCAEDNFCYSTDTLRVVFESLTTPRTTYDVRMSDARKTLIHRQNVPGGYDPALYRSERIAVPGGDGARIPASLVYRKECFQRGTNPLLIYAYGSYGISTEPGFDADIVSLLDRGFVLAIAHVRGGSELGRDWYYSGRQFNKWNTFTDFVDTTRYLVETGYAAPDNCFAMGGSAGGLLMGVVANEAPDLYRGIIAQVPFVDVVTTMLDDTIPLTTGEFDEWGDPGEREAFEYMLSYSPYDNVKDQPYPSLLVTAGLHDSQVQYWEPAKWVAKLRVRSTGQGVILLKTDMQAGHSGKTGRYRSLEETALHYSFLLMLSGDPA